MLGCAILAAAAAGLHDGDVHVAAKNMVRVKHRLEPSPAKKLLYDQVYAKYQQLAPALRPLEPFYAPLSSASTSSSSPAPAASGDACRTIIAPSLLASDWWDIKAAVTQCEAVAEAAGGRLWLHIDMFDGVAVDSPHALTFGPQMVAAIRKRTKLLLDVHLVAKSPLRYVDALAAAGAHRVHLQVSLSPTVLPWSKSHFATFLPSPPPPPAAPILPLLSPRPLSATCCPAAVLMACSPMCSLHTPKTKNGNDAVGIICGCRVAGQGGTGFACRGGFCWCLPCPQGLEAPLLSFPSSSPSLLLSLPSFLSFPSPFLFLFLLPLLFCVFPNLPGGKHRPVRDTHVLGMIKKIRILTLRSSVHPPPPPILIFLLTDPARLPFLLLLLLLLLFLVDLRWP